MPFAWTVSGVNELDKLNRLELVLVQYRSEPLNRALILIVAL